MTIAKLHKVTLLGDLTQKQKILEGLQELGVLHLIPLQEIERDATGSEHEFLKEALTYLENCPNRRRLQSPDEDKGLSSVVELVLRNKQTRSHLLDQMELIRTRIRDLKPWGTFEYPDLDTLDGYRLWFYHVPVSRLAETGNLSLPWKILSTDHKQAYMVVIANHEPDDTEVPFTRVHVGSRSLKQLNIDLEESQIELEELNAEREALTRWLQPLRASLTDSINLARLKQAADEAKDADECFAIQAWIPRRHLDQLEALSKTLGFAYFSRKPQGDDCPPTLLENESAFGGGEAAVSFFQLPGYRSWDPSTVIFFSFSLFFAIILADAGYALILAGVLAYYWKRLGQDEHGKRMRNFASAIIGASIVYGTLVGSWFGIELDEDSLLGKLHLLDLNDFHTMMQLSIGIGALHVIIANASVLWRERRRYTAFGRLGWILLISCCYLIWFQYVNYDTAPTWSSWPSLIAILGFSLQVVFSSERKVDSTQALGMRVFDGLLAIYQVTKAFGDILSYMRLFALGLSSASLAVTFNHLAVEAANSVPAGGAVLFFLIVLLGHSLNFILALVGGLVHGLRLNLLEFYGWAIKGEGSPFVPFSKQQTKKT